MLLAESLLGSSVATSATYVEDVFSTFLYTGTGASQIITNQIALGNGASTPGWISSLPDVEQTGIATDSSSNIYTLGDVGNAELQITKYNSTGSLLWQRKLTVGQTIFSKRHCIGVDSSGNVYICAQVGTGPTSAFVAKYDTNGTLQWQRFFTSLNVSTAFTALAVTPSGTVYVGGVVSTNFLLVKYDTNGTLQWERRLLLGESAFQTEQIALDASENIYIASWMTRNISESNIDFGYILKYSSAGNLLWQRSLGTDTAQVRAYTIAAESGGDFYIGTELRSGGFDAGPYIAKFNTSATPIWQRQVSAVGFGFGNFAFESIALASASSLYAAMGYNYIVKCDTSGSLSYTNFSPRFLTSVIVDAQSRPCFVGESLIYKLPEDGSGGGSYTVGTTVAEYSPYRGTSFVSASMAVSIAVYSSAAGSGSSGAGANVSSTPTSIVPALVSLTEAVGSGGLVWMKRRNSTDNHALYDTARGATFDIASNTAGAQTTQSTGLTGFLANGFSIGPLTKINSNTAPFISWTFREQPKFFDVVTYTGDGVQGRNIPHALGSVPGCMIIKETAASDDWIVYHRSLGNLSVLNLNFPSQAVAVDNTIFANNPTSTNFIVGSSGAVNQSGQTYVAYLFAHNAGGFGAAGSDNVISCGKYMGNGSAAGPEISLGWEPQWLLIKRADGAGNWNIIDNMRGFPVGSNDAVLSANLTNAETLGAFVAPAATGFNITTTDTNYNATGNDHIYIAIRRGPMRTPTSGASVFNPVVYTGTNVDNRLVNTSIAPDMVFVRQRNDTVLGGMVVGDRLRAQPYLLTGTTDAEVNDADAFDQQLVSAVEYGTAFSAMNGFWCGNDTVAKLNPNATSNVAEAFRRAPGFFDVVCYTGTGVARTVSHNLGVVPEFVIWKSRTNLSTVDWYVCNQANDIGLNLQTTGASFGNVFTVTSTGISLGVGGSFNTLNDNCIFYLFASCPGVSKVGTYTGTGATQVINCGFAAGARFVLIKRTDSTGDWYVWDSARGIVAGNDPYLALNSTAAEVTNTDWVDTAASGFELSNAGGNLVNTNGASYIFLAVS